MADAASTRARVVEGELVDSPEYAVDLDRARRLARLLDTAVAIPGTNIRFGLDALIGLVPGIGDALSVLLSAQIVIAGARSGVPFAVLVRMLLNLVVDTVVGAVPLLGDLFDVGFKANQRNFELLERHHGRVSNARGGKRRVAWAAGAILAVVVLLAGLAIFLAFAGINAAIGALR